MMIPLKVFFTKGVGVHKDMLASFELALRKAGIEKCNLVSVSSILPPGCKRISKDAGLKELRPGQIVYVVLAREETNEPNRLLSAAIAWPSRLTIMNMVTSLNTTPLANRQEIRRLCGRPCRLHAGFDARH